MKKVDLHVHSIYSEIPSDFIFKLLKTKECYTSPESLYHLAKKNGMDFVAITDHNKIDGALLLKEKFPEEVIVGVEATTFFPEDNCPIHLLVYGLDEVQFRMIEKLRYNIYDLRDFIKEENLAYSVAHANFAEDEKLDVHHIEKLILLFDTFEIINGGMNKISNSGIKLILNNLKDVHIENLYSKHGITPFSDTPWIKGYTGGSDDHAGIFIGSTFTQAKVETVDEFLEAIKNKSTHAFGKNGNFQKLIFSAYKVLYDHWKNSKITFSIPNLVKKKIHDIIFEQHELKFLEKLLLKSLIKISPKSDLNLAMQTLLKTSETFPLEKRFDTVYDFISDFTDMKIKTIIHSVESGFQEGKFNKLLQNITSIVPVSLLTLPFLISTKHITKDNFRIKSLFKTLFKVNYQKGVTLWFTDTFSDLNGVSASLNEMVSKLNGNYDVIFVTGENDRLKNAPPRLLQLPVIHRISLPYYERQIISIPSILKSLKILDEVGEVKEIIISTPGPIGLLGLLVSKLLNVKSISIYHTDFYAQSLALSENENLAKTLESYVKWFYSQTDEILVPTEQYISILKDREYPSEKLRSFYRGTDKNLFSPVEFAKKQFGEKYGINGVNLLYVGRVSKDKGMDFLIDCFKETQKTYDDLNLIIVGDGPYKDELVMNNSNKKIFFLGKVSREELPLIYSASDLFLFPSVTDTFGLAVLEAQMCGLPAIVSDVGGPKEIVINGKTGFVVSAWNKKVWTETISKVLDMIENNFDGYLNLKINSRNLAIERYDFDKMISILFDSSESDKKILIEN